MDDKCHQSELEMAESHMNAQDDEPSARECYMACAHAPACGRVALMIPPAERGGSLWDTMGCDECEEYEE